MDSDEDEAKLRHLEKLLTKASTVTRDLEENWRNRSGPRSRELFETKVELASELSETLNYGTILAKLLRNDSGTRVVDGNIFPPGHGRALGTALVDNTVVERLDLDLDRFLPAEYEEGAEEEMKGLLEFLAVSTSLVHFGVDARKRSTTDKSLTVANSLLEGISTCKSLQRLKWGLHVDSSEFHKVMTMLQSLEELDIVFRFHRRSGYSASERQEIASAFRLNRSLQKLTLCHYVDEELFTAILASLHENQMLRVVRFISPWANDLRAYLLDAISLYLGNTRALERLEMQDFQMTASHMAQLLSGLCHHRSAGGLPTTELCALHFDGCYMYRNEGALEQLVEFLQTVTYNLDGTKVYESCLNELSFVGELLFEEICGRLAASLLTATAVDEHGHRAADNSGRRRPPKWIPTIGSQIKTLCLEYFHHSFLYHLKDNADRVRLQTLQLHGLERVEGVVLNECLPKLVSLRKLGLLRLRCSQRDLRWIVRGLKGNASIVEVETDDKGTVQFSAPQRRLIDAYCQRNQHLDALIASIVPKSGDTPTGIDDGSPGRAGLGLCSTLLECVQPLEHARTTILIRGLSALCDGIGDESTDRIRLRPLA